MFDSNQPRQHLTSKTTSLALSLKQARIEAGMTQKALADFSGVGLKVIRTIEQGGYNVSLEKLHALCDFLGLEILILSREKAVLLRQPKQVSGEGGESHA